MRSIKHQTVILVGVAMIIIGVIIMYISMGNPRVYVDEERYTVPHSEYQEGTTVEEITVADSTTTTTKKYHSKTNAAITTTSKPTPTVFPINLNTATFDQLTQISGVGEVTASRILAYREELGGYTSVDQIKNISGIGEKKFAAISPYLTV